MVAIERAISSDRDQNSGEAEYLEEARRAKSRQLKQHAGDSGRRLPLSADVLFLGPNA